MKTETRVLNLLPKLMGKPFSKPMLKAKLVVMEAEGGYNTNDPVFKFSLMTNFLVNEYITTQGQAICFPRLYFS